MLRILSTHCDASATAYTCASDVDLTPTYKVALDKSSRHMPLVYDMNASGQMTFKIPYVMNEGADTMCKVSCYNISGELICSADLSILPVTPTRDDHKEEKKPFPVSSPIKKKKKKATVQKKMDAMTQTYDGDCDTSSDTGLMDEMIFNMLYCDDGCPIPPTDFSDLESPPDTAVPSEADIETSATEHPLAKWEEFQSGPPSEIGDKEAPLMHVHNLNARLEMILRMQQRTSTHLMHYLIAMRYRQRWW